MINNNNDVFQNDTFQLSEASLGRVFQKITEKMPFGVITAFRGEYSLSENRKRNKILQDYLKSLRFGYNKVQGYYVEKKGPVVEESFIVYAYRDREKELFDFLKSACIEFEQESVLLVSEGEGSLWRPTNELLEKIGPFHANPSNLQAYFTKIKGRPFFFGSADPQSGESSLNECVIESEPIRESSYNMSDFMVFDSDRHRLRVYEELFFESINETRANQ